MNECTKILWNLSEYQRNYIYDTYEISIESRNEKHRNEQSLVLWNIANFLSENRGQEMYHTILEYCESRYKAEN